MVRDGRTSTDQEYHGNQKMTTVSLLTAQGISALKAGDKKEAQKWLRLALKRNPNDITAWLWLSGAVESDDERLECLQQVLRIDPDNAPALTGISKLKAKPKSFETPIPGGEPAVSPFIENGIEDLPLKSHPPSKVSPFALEKHQKNQEKLAERQVFDVRPSLIPAFVSALLVFIVLGVAAWTLLNYSDGSTAYLTVWAIIFGSLLLANFWIIIRALIHYSTSRYRLTTWNLVVQSGVFSRNYIKIPASNIRSVTHQKRLFTRIFRVGDIFIDASAGQGMIKMRSLARCQKRANQIAKVIELHH